MKIKVNDYVKIIKPSFFKRCGYEICREDAINLLKEEEHQNEIVTFLKKFIKNPEERDIYKLTKELASLYMANYTYKSKERKIYNFELSEHQDTIAKVIKINYVRTGTYNDGSYGTAEDYYFGQGDYYPPYLTNVKNHKILTINKYIDTKYGIENLKIEANNIQTIEDEEVLKKILEIEQSKNKLRLCTNQSYIFE